MDKPKIDINELMRDGNAFHLIGVARRAAQNAGWSKEQISTLIADLTSGDYDHLMIIIERQFDIS